jgi:hypothetical protein
MIVVSLVLTLGVPPPETVTWFAWGEVAFAKTLTTMVMAGYDVPAASASLRVHVLLLHVQPVPLIDVIVSPPGAVSVTVTGPMLAPVPVFDTSTVYVPVCP